MILQALYQLAQKEGLMTDPDYEPKPVAWLVRVGRDGKFLGIQGTHSISSVESTKKKPKSLPRKFSVPREGGRTSGDRAFFLYDKSEYALGLDPDQKQSAEKLAARFALFRARVKECYEETKDEGLRAVDVFLTDLAEKRTSISLPDTCASNDLFAFVYDPDTDLLVTDREKVRASWKRQRAISEGSDAEASKQICLVSGAPCVPAKLVPSIKRVPGGSTSGVALVSFNARAFESYGWSSSENAPISRDAAEACSSALNRLLDPAYPDPRQPGQSLLKQNLRLSADTVVCYWSAERGQGGFSSVFAPLLEANPDEVKELYHSIWRGRLPEIQDPSAFYALTLSGSQGRAIVRDWFEATVADVERNLAAHFRDVDIVRNTPKPRDRDLPPQLPLRPILESLAPLGRQDEIPAQLAGEVVRAAMSGTVYPLSLLQRALERFRAEIGRTDWGDIERRDARVALIKAVLNRRKRIYPSTTHYKEVQRDMDAANTNLGYLLGRLMALIERMQQVALGDINASAVDRFFGSASATPRAVFPRLMKNLRHHARKAKDEASSVKTAGWLEGQIDQIMALLPDFPAFLDLEQQGLFIVGYHHERHWLWLSKEDRIAAQPANQ